MANAHDIALTHTSRRAEHSRGGVLFEIWATAMLIQLDQKLNRVLGMELHQIQEEDMIMAKVQVEQDDIDGLASGFESLVAAVDAIDVTSLPEGTLDGVKTALTDLTDHVNAKLPVVTPVTPPSDEPTA